VQQRRRAEWEPRRVEVGRPELVGREQVQRPEEVAPQAALERRRVDPRVAEQQVAEPRVAEPQAEQQRAVREAQRVRGEPVGRTVWEPKWRSMRTRRRSRKTGKTLVPFQ